MPIPATTAERSVAETIGSIGGRACDVSPYSSSTSHEGLLNLVSGTFQCSLGQQLIAVFVVDLVLEVWTVRDVTWLRLLACEQEGVWGCRAVCRAGISPLRRQPLNNHTAQRVTLKGLCGCREAKRSLARHATGDDRTSHSWSGRGQLARLGSKRHALAGAECLTLGAVDVWSARSPVVGLRCRRFVDGCRDGMHSARDIGSSCSANASNETPLPEAY
jgi:hypothetical protein